MFRPSKFLRLLGFIALIVYFSIAALLLGVRYWVLPNIDQWRPYIAQQLSIAAGTQVTLGKVTADWKGLNPGLEVNDIDFTDGRQRGVFRLPQVRAVLSWRSLFMGTPQFVTLDATGLDLSVRRDAANRLWLLGRSFELEQGAGPELGLDNPTIQWLIGQRHLVIRNSTIRWVDERRTPKPLMLQHVTLEILSKSSGHRLSLRATPPGSLGQSMDIRGEFSRFNTSLPDASPEAWNGEIYVHVDDLRPLGWKPWVDIPQNLSSGRVTAQAWLSIRQGHFEKVTSDVSVNNGHWELGSGANIRTKSARLYLAGPWKGFARIFSNPETQETMSASAPDIALPDAGATPSATIPGIPIEFRFNAEAVDFQSPEQFSHPLDFSQTVLQGTLERQPDRTLKADFRHAHVINSDLDIQLTGTWQQGGSGPGGLADMKGLLRRADISAIHRYLPTMVNLDAREWLATGLVAGQIHNAPIVLQGDLEHFPFGDDPSRGDFSIRGRVTGGIIDYVPTVGKTLGWPRLTDIAGTVALHRVDLQINADRATVAPAADKPIKLTDVVARIPNIEQNSVLSIQGDTTAPGAAYLALMTHSPLGGLLDDVFNEARGDGIWQVPLSLTVPLLNSRDTMVHGAVRFNGGSVSLMPEMPTLTQVNGVLNFTERGIDTSNLKAHFLGGPIALSGGVGGTQNGLQIRGQASSNALNDYVGIAGMKRLEGKLAYRAVVQRNAKHFMLSLDSDLVGLGLDFPEPLGKPPARAMPLHAAWSPLKDTNGMELTIALGSTMKANLLHSRTDKTATYFYAGAIGVGKSPDLLSGGGLNIDIQFPKVDADQWNQVIDDFSGPVGKEKSRRERALLPQVRQLRLQSESVQFHGAQFDKTTFTAKQPEPLNWRMDISSSQTAGTIFWREANGKIAGQVDAKFDRLAFGNASDINKETTQTADELSRVNEDLDIPAINLQATNFKMYGRDLGQLSVEGVNQSRGQLWKLDKLSLTSPSAHLKGTGAWRLSGSERGLTLDAQADISDLGQYFEQIGFKNVLKGGNGTVAGQLEWRDFPWNLKKSDLNGHLEFRLEKGRFSTVNSRSARLLELLSLQSIQRLATFNFNPGGLLKEGFPFDTLRGTVQVNRGVLSTDDYRVIGPVGTIVIGGDVSLNTEGLDLQAVVIPNLDVSGAAIAAGIAINPIVGIGAFLTQWLLRTPLAKAMTAQYHVSGNWDDPKVNEVARVKEPKARSDRIPNEVAR